MLKHILLAASGGALGAAGRYLVGAGAERLFGLSFPWGTLIVNVAGSFLMGILISFLALRSAGGDAMRVFLAVGVLGGFTTFSAFSLDVVALIERKAFAMAAVYLFASVLVSIAALLGGLYLSRNGFK